MSLTISERTLTVLKNFASINQSIWIEANAERLRTISPAKNIMGIAEIEEKFPVDFGIYDIGEFLNTLGLFDDPILEFDDRSVLISEKSGGASGRYFFASREVILSPQKDIQLGDPDVSFVMEGKVLSKLLKASSVMMLPNVHIVLEEGEDVVEIRATKSDIPSTNTYVVDVPNCQYRAGSEFLFDFLTENLKMIPGDYEVGLYRQKIGRFVNVEGDLTYYITMQQSSEYKD